MLIMLKPREDRDVRIESVSINTDNVSR